MEFQPQNPEFMKITVLSLPNTGITLAQNIIIIIHVKEKYLSYDIMSSSNIIVTIDKPPVSYI